MAEFLAIFLPIAILVVVVIIARFLAQKDIRATMLFSAVLLLILGGLACVPIALGCDLPVLNEMIFGWMFFLSPVALLLLALFFISAVVKMISKE